MSDKTAARSAIPVTRLPDPRPGTRGEVIEYDASRGWAIVRTDEGDTVELWCGAFRSGRPVRHPRVGDRVAGSVSDGGFEIAFLETAQ